MHVETESEHELKMLIEHAKNTRFKERLLGIVGTEHINRLLIYDISPVVREDEIYGVLREISKGLYGVTLFDTNTPQGILSAGVCLVEYDDYICARSAMLAIFQRHTELRAVLSPEFKVMWAEPLFDYFAEFALCTRALHVKNLPVSYPFEEFYRQFSKYGNILKIRRYSNNALIYYSKPSEARLAFESLSEFELENGVICKLSLARIKLKDTNHSPELPPTEAITSKLSTLNLLELGPTESIGLTQLLMHGSLPDHDLILNKARSIVKRASFAHMAAHQATPAQSVVQPKELPNYDIVPVTDSISIQGKRLAEIERDDVYSYKKPKQDLDTNPFVTQAHYYGADQPHFMRPPSVPPAPPITQPSQHSVYTPSYQHRYSASSYNNMSPSHSTTSIPEQLSSNYEI